MADPIKFSESLPDNAVLKISTAAGVSNVNYGPTSETGWYNGLRTTGYTIIKAQEGDSPLIYAPATDDEFIQFCNTTANPGPSTTITTVGYGLDFLSTSEYMVFHGTENISNFPVGLPMTGLSCYVDAQIEESSGTANKWYDISGNGLEFNSNGTSLSKVSLGGYTGFQFNDSGYFQCNDKFNAVNIGGDCTIVMWVWCTSIASRDTIFEKVGNGGTSYQCSVAITWETNEAFSYYSRKTPNYDSAGTSACDTNSGEGAWTMMAIKMSTGLTSTARTGFYSKNGANWTANYNSRSNTALVRGQQIRIGTGYAGVVEGTNGIGALLTYNKMLSDTEIEEVYDAMKSKFGLS